MISIATHLIGTLSIPATLNTHTHTHTHTNTHTHTHTLEFAGHANLHVGEGLSITYMIMSPRLKKC
jgi:hypothetical protein